jgi:hypothetical protein
LHEVNCLLLVSSESDSAALAPLQQDLCISRDWLVQNLSRIDALDPVQNSLRERPQDVWQVSVSLGGGQTTHISTLFDRRHTAPIVRERIPALGPVG